MKMTERIRKLREQSLNAENRISAERALLLLNFINRGWPMPNRYRFNGL